MTHSVAVCTLEAIDRTAPRGFAARWSCVVNRLADTCVTTLIDVVAPGQPPPDHESALADRLAGRRTLVLDPPLSDRLRSRLGPVGRGASIAVDAASGRPPWLFGAADKKACRRAVSGFDAVVVPYHLAHLVETVGDSVPVIAFLDEGPERRIFAYQGGGGPTAAHGALRRHAAESLYRTVGEHAAVVVAISEVERFLFGTYVPADRLVVVPDTTDPALTALRRSPPPADGHIGLVVCGRFDMQHKTYAGLGELVQGADSSLRQAGLEPKWTLAGRGAANVPTGPAECIRWEGDDLREVYGPADLAVVPGPTVIGVRSTLLQAFASATPAVAMWDAMWTLGANPDRDAFTARGPNDMPDVITQAATSGRLKEVGAAGRRFHSAHNSWEIVGDAAVAACKDAIDRSVS